MAVVMITMVHHGDDHDGDDDIDGCDDVDDGKYEKDHSALDLYQPYRHSLDEAINWLVGNQLDFYTCLDLYALGKRDKKKTDRPMNVVKAMVLSLLKTQLKNKRRYTKDVSYL